MKFLILLTLLVGQVYAQQRQYEGFYSLEIRLLESKGDSLVLNGRVLIRDTSSKHEFYVATDSNGFAKVLLPANRVYEFTGMRDDYYDSKPITELMSSDNRKIAISNDRMQLYSPMPFSMFDKVLFKNGSIEISSTMRVVLDSFCNAVNAYKKRVLIFEVRGNTRITKNHKGDFELAKKRAEVVASYLKERTFNSVFVSTSYFHYNALLNCGDRRCSETELEEFDNVEIILKDTREN